MVVGFRLKRSFERLSRSLGVLLTTNLMRLVTVPVGNSGEMFPKLNRSPLLKVDDDETLREGRGVEVNLKTLRACSGGFISGDLFVVLLVRDVLSSVDTVMWLSVDVEMSRGIILEVISSLGS